jgi:hypothetical protein
MENNYGICLQEYIPVRSDVSEKSEMVTQAIFGDLFKVLERDKLTRFTLIRLEDDKYEGWVDDKTIQYLNVSEFDNLKKLPEKLVHERNFRVVDKNKNEMWLSAGSILRLKPGNNIYGTLSMYSPNMKNLSPRKIMEDSAEEWINVSYIWGGKTTSGTDCSGLTQNIYRQAGILIPRDACQQSAIGKNINFVFEAQAGDLAFFDNEEGIIDHVGMILSGNRIIHASGKVRIDLFDQQGIYSREKGNYTHKLRLMRNFVD